MPSVSSTIKKFLKNNYKFLLSRCYQCISRTKKSLYVPNSLTYSN
ncbi:mCG1036288, isoform CRA_a [Mus musculus]|nr:mCG1036288, isoform CRA_a [Mus musculus]EDL12557.1 mCG1036288, isoform CRA_a [Mus musculus]